MDPYRNPFAPGAGSRPPELAGRDAILEAAKISCGRAVNGRSARSIILLGLRGTGKTVLLNEIGRNAEKENLLVSRVESPEGEGLELAVVNPVGVYGPLLSKNYAASCEVVVRLMNGGM